MCPLPTLHFHPQLFELCVLSCRSPKYELLKSGEENQHCRSVGVGRDLWTAVAQPLLKAGLTLKLAELAQDQSC